MAKKSIENVNYDDAYSELKNIIYQLQSEDTGIEKLGQLVTRAKELQDICKSRLREIEDTVNKINV